MPGAIAWVGRAPRPSAWSRAVRALSVSLLSRHPLPAKLTTDPLVQNQEARFDLARTVSDRSRCGLPSPQAGSPRKRRPGANQTKPPETTLAALEGANVM